ncbi:MAG: Gfo/Idh/MocA family oxidoreductase [Chloroflexi bacterium]|nr:Gfo/Idh/MocA family oxidoreductase [Chloroflexota bacterium]
MSSPPVGVGLVGAGAYGQFCLAAFALMPEVYVAAVCDSDRVRAERFAAQYGVRAYTELSAMLNDSAVEIVALNTPPFLHAEQGLAVLQAGKHLFCEKPLALTLSEGEALRAAAEQTGTRLTVDYVMRQNPLWRMAARLREAGVLGKLLHLSLTNHAAGLSLPAQHWFWNKAQSGGIWIEHGVHFFDAFAWVAGAVGTVSAAQRFVNAAGQEDRVEALATYGETAAHFYHGFTHSGTTEQTTVALTFEHAYMHLQGWVPTNLTFSGLDAAGHAAIQPFLTDDLRVTSMSGASLVVDTSGDKSAVYRACIQAGMRDLAGAVRDPNKSLRVTVEHGLASLRMALEAERL